MENLEQALKVLYALLPANPTSQQLEEQAAKVAALLPSIDPVQLVREAQATFTILAPNYAIITNEDAYHSWLPEKIAQMDRRFWQRYRAYLEQEKSYPAKVLDRLDALSDEILDKTFDPTLPGLADKRGLVVGQVQSGKTSNYIALVCKAVDAGYRLVIILAGIHNNLRSQTQLRVDEGFFGRDSQTLRVVQDGYEKVIGAGKYSRQGISYVAHPITSSHDSGDFNRNARLTQMVNFETSDPIVIVVKKNSSVLRNLLEWLTFNAGKNGRISDKPLLLIDDEADNASINTTRDPNRATRINTQIRGILDLFDRSAYVGYTATPFANIFIPTDGDQLFPRDFIINLPAPSNYIGPDKVFGFTLPTQEVEHDGVLPIVCRIDDYAPYIPDGHKKDETLPTGLPASLRLAIRSFIITCAIRRLRGQAQAHNSMLIHVTRFMRWQAAIRDLVETEFNYYRRGIEQDDVIVLDLMRRTFEEDAPGWRSYPAVSQAILNSSLREIDPAIKTHTWAEVIPHLHEAAGRIRVREINGGSADMLDYYGTSNGLSVIAVGGDKLSRGLTLEGLSVSYYLRASKMYDTLMQMGRWFGYRPGYVDLCRLFTSAELNEWYCHIAEASEELREEFEYMSKVAGVRPLDYALKVRTHPGVLQITASNKMRNAKTVQVGFSGRQVQSYQLLIDAESMEHNLNAVLRLITKLGDPIETKERLLWRTNDWRAVADFITGFRVHPSLARARPEYVANYISETRQRGELTEWIVAIPRVSRSGGQKWHPEFAGIEGITMVIRDPEDSTSQEYFFARKANFRDPAHDLYDFDDYKSLTGKKQEYLTQRPAERALLRLYPIDPTGTSAQRKDIPLLGYVLSFPHSRANVTDAYAIPEQLLHLFDVNDLTDSDYEDENS